jgi:uncharacterized membrane protein
LINIIFEEYFLFIYVPFKVVGFNHTFFVDLSNLIVIIVSLSAGSLIGAMTGALIGLATESGMFRGAGIGAISGAVFSIEVVDSSLDLWNSTDSGVWSILYMVFYISFDQFLTAWSNN